MRQCARASLARRVAPPPIPRLLADLPRASRASGCAALDIPDNDSMTRRSDATSRMPCGSCGAARASRIAAVLTLGARHRRQHGDLQPGGRDAAAAVQGRGPVTALVFESTGRAHIPTTWTTRSARTSSTACAGISAAASTRRRTARPSSWTRLRLGQLLRRPGRAGGRRPGAVASRR